MLILPEENPVKTSIETKISNALRAEVEAYCAWAKIENIDFFIEKACQYIISNDNDWINHKTNL